MFALYSNFVVAYFTAAVSITWNLAIELFLWLGWGKQSELRYPSKYEQVLMCQVHFTLSCAAVV